MLIDTHCHPDGFLNAGNFEEVWKRSQSSGVGAWIAIGTEANDIALYANLAKTHPFIFYTVGVHPFNLSSLSFEALEQGVASWDQHLEAKGFVGVGEIGLDYSRLPESLKEREALIEHQQECFKLQLLWAVKWGLPIVVHARDAFEDTLKILESAQVDGRKVVFHCFTEGPEAMQQLKLREMRASFTGIITFKNAEKIRAALKSQGLDRLMIETDAPYLTPVPYRGKPNEPAYLRSIAQFVATDFGISLPELTECLEYNSRMFFDRLLLA